MNENLFEAQYNVTKKSKLKKFYETNKIFIFSIIIVSIISVASLSFYLASKEKKKTFLADNYIEAKVYLENGDEKTLREIGEKLGVTRERIRKLRRLTG